MDQLKHNRQINFAKSKSDYYKTNPKQVEIRKRRRKLESQQESSKNWDALEEA